MKYCFLIFCVITGMPAFSQKSSFIEYEALFSKNNVPVKNSAVGLELSILKAAPGGIKVYSEQHKVVTDSFGMYHIDIGNGRPVLGKFDSIIWSDGIYYLRTQLDEAGGNNYTITKNVLLRMPPDLSKDYEQGTVVASDDPTFGEFILNNSRNRRPKLVTVDLTTSYANVAYPANTYPIYRHYEWCDPDQDGVGNAFFISYSENTNNGFKENTTVLGDVRLYPKAFQQLNISSTAASTGISITKPVAILNHSETYAIKGPWKFIYYIEW